MKALVYKGPEKIELEDVQKPAPKEDELLIKIMAVGICGSDIQGYLGKTGRRTPPMIMGHELAGVVEVAGDNSKLRKGDKVVIYPKLYCGSCDYCKVGLTNMCPEAEFLGVLEKNGGMTEYITIHKDYVLKVNEDVSFKEACMVEPLAVAYRATNRVETVNIQNAKYLIVVGAGTIGLLILQVLKLKGSKNIIVSELCDGRLEKAKELRADFTIDPRKNDFLSRIKEITEGNLVDYSFEAVGFSTSACQSLKALRKCGTAVWIGNAQKIIEANMQRIVTNEINIKGSFIYTKADFINSLKLIEARKINFESIISLEEKLENGEEMFKRLKENKDGKLIKVILRS